VALQELYVADAGPGLVEAGAVSHHLKILAEPGLIVGDKRGGRWVWYRAVPERPAQLRGVLA